MKRANRSFADENTSEEAARAEYRRIAERRVRLGLVLAQIGEATDIKVTDDEVTQALVERVRQFPGQEKQVWEFYRKNPQAIAEIRAPIFEEKVVDHILVAGEGVRGAGLEEALFKDEDARGRHRGNSPLAPIGTARGGRRPSHGELEAGRRTGGSGRRRAE